MEVGGDHDVTDAWAFDVNDDLISNELDKESFEEILKDVSHEDVNGSPDKDVYTSSTDILDDNSNNDYNGFIRAKPGSIDNFNEQIEPPCVGMAFESGTELLVYFHKYAKQSGFQFHIRTSESKEKFSQGVKTGKMGKRHIEEFDYNTYTRLRLACTKGGMFKSKSKNPSKSEKTQVTGCKAFIDGYVSNGQMRITNVNLDHNHDLCPHFSRLKRNYRNIGDYHKRRILDNDRAGVPPIKNFTSFAVESDGIQNVPFSEEDLRNLISEERRRSVLGGDAVALEEFFKEMINENPYFFREIDLDDKGHVRSIFWADARSRAAFKSFGDVVTFDTTHLTNRYHMPFAVFIGVNHHGQSIILGCALITQETTETFEWIFTQFIKCMGSAPLAILTDQCRAIKNAIHTIFPMSKHRLCLWHIMRNGAKHLGKYKTWEDGIKPHLKAVVHDSLDLEEFENGWSEMVEKYGLAQNSWIKDTYEIRKDWIPAYWRDTFWAGMSSTQRSEGFNFFFKGYVNLNSGLRVFIEQYMLALDRKINQEEKLNHDSMDKPMQCRTEVYLEKIFQEIYTSSIFRQVQEEFKGLALSFPTKLDKSDDSMLYYYVKEKKVNQIWRWVSKWKIFDVTLDKQNDDFFCSCKLFEFKGILCKHILCVMVLEDLNYVPEKYILDRWKKNVIRDYEKIKLRNYDPKNSRKMEKYHELHNIFETVYPLALHSKDTFDQTASTLLELKRKLEVLVGIDDTRRAEGSSHPTAHIGRCYGKKKKKQNLSEKTTPCATEILLDPEDKRRKGKASQRRKKPKFEKGLQNKHRKCDQNKPEKDVIAPNGGSSEKNGKRVRFDLNEMYEESDNANKF